MVWHGDPGCFEIRTLFSRSISIATRNGSPSEYIEGIAAGADFVPLALVKNKRTDAPSPGPRFAHASGGFQARLSLKPIGRPMPAHSLGIRSAGTGHTLVGRSSSPGRLIRP